MLSSFVDKLHMLKFLLDGMFTSIDDRFFRRRGAYNWQKKLADLTAGSYPHMQERWAVVTGANSGIGYELSKLLLKCGISVVLACRSDVRGAEAQRSLQTELREGDGRAEYVNLDVGDLKSVTKFAQTMQGRGVGLVVCNAGGMLTPWTLTPQGFESVFGTHVMGHALLSQLLLPELMRSNKGTARIVTVSSKTIEHGVFLDNFFARPPVAPASFNRFANYSNVKTTQTCCTLALADELGCGDVAVHAVHPGCVQTDIVTNSTLPFSSLLTFLANSIQISAVEGASYVLRACLHADSSPSPACTGRYFHCGQPSSPGLVASDTKVRKNAWQLLQQAFHEGGWLSPDWSAARA